MIDVDFADVYAMLDEIRRDSEAEAYRIAVHEFGHAELGRAHGLEPLVELWPDAWGLSWHGLCSWPGARGWRDPLRFERMTKLIALAGRAAELHMQNPDLDAGALHAAILISPGWAGSVDAGNAGDFTTADVSTCLYFLRAQWGRILEQAADWRRHVRALPSTESTSSNA